MPQLVSVKLDETLSPEMLTAMSDYVRAVITSHRSEKERQLEGTIQARVPSILLSEEVKTLLLTYF
jgi:hypothetical protein